MHARENSSVASNPAKVMKCQICDSDYNSKSALAAHLCAHDISSKKYTIEHVYDGERPKCLVCGEKTKYSSFEFNKFCEEHTVPGPDFDESIKDNPDLFEMYHADNELHPAQVSISSGKKIKWSCEKGHVWFATPSNLSRQKNNCPCCAGNTLCLNGSNSLAVKYPEIAEEWHNSKNNKSAEEVLPSGKDKVWWKCENGHEWQSTISNRVYNQAGCPACNGAKIYKQISCKICGGKYSGNEGLFTHVAIAHDIEPNEYYVKFLHEGEVKNCKANGCEKDRKYSTSHDRFLETCGSEECVKSRQYSQGLYKGSKPLSREEVDERLKKQNFELLEDGQCLTDEKVELKCTECGHKFKRPLKDQLHKKYNCVNCSDKFSSEAEKEIAEWLKNRDFKVKTNLNSIISPYEVDVYLPEHDMGIEYHGLFWHSEKRKSKDYHQQKFHKAQENDITLLQFFEDQWRDKKDICKSILLHHLNQSPQTIYARECDVRRFEGGSEAVRSFFNDNHLMGAGSSFREGYGLVYEGELVSCMTVRGSMHYDADEIVRFAHKTYHHIPGALSRLLSRFDPPLVTYADLMHGDGSGYKSHGFEEKHVTDPNYWYTDFSHRLPRQQFQATQDKTEREIANEAGVSRIYGAGNKLFAKFS